VGAAPAQAARQVARTILVVALAGLVWSGVTSSARADANPPIGDTTVFASVPYPGHPGGIVVDGHTVYVDTFNPVDRASDDYDAIFTYNLATGALRSDRPNPIKVPRMMSPAIMGLAAMALDAEGRLYVADMNGRIVRVDPKTGAQSDYATFPTNTMTSVSNMPAGIAFDDEGDLYVTDASAPIIWRVPPGGGEAKAWFADPALAGVWGVTGLNAAAIDPSGTYLYFSMQYSSATAVYRLPLNQPESRRSISSTRMSLRRPRSTPATPRYRGYSAPAASHSGPRASSTSSSWGRIRSRSCARTEPRSCASPRPTRTRNRLFRTTIRFSPPSTARDRSWSPTSPSDR